MRQGELDKSLTLWLCQKSWHWSIVVLGYAWVELCLHDITQVGFLWLHVLLRDVFNLCDLGLHTSSDHFFKLVLHEIIRFFLRLRSFWTLIVKRAELFIHLLNALPMHHLFRVRADLNVSDDLLIASIAKALQRPRFIVPNSLCFHRFCIPCNMIALLARKTVQSRSRKQSTVLFLLVCNLGPF